MTWNSIIGIVSSLALFLPIFFILISKLGTYRGFAVLLVYYSSAFIYNFFFEGYISVPVSFRQNWAITHNFLDVPMMIYFLTYFCTTKIFARRMKLAILSFLLFELIVIFITGYNINAVTIVLGPGLLLVFGISLFFFVRQVKITIKHGKAMGKALMISSVLFAYGCFIFLYLMYYVFKAHLDEFGKEKPQYKADTFLIYFIVTILSSLLMCAGIIIERRRIRKLSELKITRKELSSIYTETKRAAPYRTAMLDFDKEQWN